MNSGGGRAAGDEPGTLGRYYCPECDKQQPLTAPCGHVDIEPGALRRVQELLEVREATDAEQRAALEVDEAVVTPEVQP